MGKEWDEEVRATLKAHEKDRAEELWTENELWRCAEVLKRASTNDFSCE